jgi:hypothetical protein
MTVECAQSGVVDEEGDGYGGRCDNKMDGGKDYAPRRRNPIAQVLIFLDADVRGNFYENEGDQATRDLRSATYKYRIRIGTSEITAYQDCQHETMTSLYAHTRSIVTVIHRGGIVCEILPRAI